jgi:ferritin-like metal-binding protein YciE
MSLRDVLIEELKDLYSAENQLVKALPKTAKGTNSPELKQAFLNHLEETKGHVVRLQQCFELLGQKAKAKHCNGMEGAITEVKEALAEDEEGALLDAGIIGAAARVEHYEIAGYTASIAMARTVGATEVAGLLTQTLNEELNASKLVMTLAKTILKEAATQE